MKTIKLSEVDPQQKVALFKALKLPLSTEGILILEDPVKPDYEPGSDAHLNYLIDHQPAMVGIMITNIDYQIEFGTYENPFAFHPAHPYSILKLQKILNDFNRDKTKKYDDFNDLMDHFPHPISYDLGQLELVEQTGKDYSCPLQIIMRAPATLNGQFDIAEDVNNAFYEGDVAMNFVTSTVDISLVSLENKDYDDGKDIIFPTSKEDIQNWMVSRGKITGDEYSIARSMKLDLQ